MYYCVRQAKFFCGTSSLRCVRLFNEAADARERLRPSQLPEIGRYYRVRLSGEPPDVYSQIGHTFDELAKRPDCDASRPVIEFYRSRDVIDLLQPVA